MAETCRINGRCTRASSRSRRLLSLLLLALVATFAAPRVALGGDDCIDDEAARHRQAAMGAGAPPSAAADPVAGLDAARLYLDRLNVLGTRQARTSCFDTMAADVPKLRELYCKDDSVQRDTDTCALLDKIQADILRLDAQRLVERGDKLGIDDGQPLFEQAGTAYLDMYRLYCKEPVRNGRTSHVAREACDEIAYNSARAFVAAHRMVKAVVVYRMLVTDAERTHRVSPLAAKAMYRVGTGYQAMGLYEEAAEWYERFAAIHSREPDAVTALSDAVILRLALGDDAAATKDVAMAVERSGVATRGKTAALVFGLAAHQAERGQKEKARATLRGALGLLDRGPLDITIRSHALLATLAETPVVARAEHAKVRSAWANPAAAERTLRGGWPGESEGQLDHRVARVLNDVGAALFFAAEERRHAEVDSVKLPLHTGPFDQTALTAYASTPLRDWAAQRRAAIERLKSQYLLILDLEPWPSPRWVIAAGSAVGSMWGELADDLHRVAAAAAWKKDPILYKSLMDALDAMGGPILAARAKSAMKKCIDLSVKYQFTDEHSRSCEAWLLVHDKTEFHAVEELIPPLRPPPGLPLPAPLLR